MVVDLFDPGEKKSIVRQAFRGITPNVSVEDRFIFPKEWNTRRILLPREGYFTRIWNAVQPLNFELSSLGYQAESLTPVIEAVKNAHEHGNNYDPEKIITLGWNFSEDYASIGVEDEGGKFHSDFGPWILWHKQGSHLEIKKDRTPTTFYTFSHKNKLNKKDGTPEENHGTGITRMYLLASDITYHLGETGGLVCTFNVHKNK